METGKHLKLTTTFNLSLVWFLAHAENDSAIASGATVHEDFNAHPKQAAKHVSPLAILVPVSVFLAHGIAFTGLCKWGKAPTVTTIFSAVMCRFEKRPITTFHEGCTGPKFN